MPNGSLFLDMRIRLGLCWTVRANLIITASLDQRPRARGFLVTWTRLFRGNFYLLRIEELKEYSKMCILWRILTCLRNLGRESFFPYYHRLSAPSSLSAAVCLGQAGIIMGWGCRWGCALFKILFSLWVSSLFVVRILFSSLQRGFMSTVLFQNIRGHAITVISLTLGFFFLIYPPQKFSTLLSHISRGFSPWVRRTFSFSLVIFGGWTDNSYLIFSAELYCVWRLSLLRQMTFQYSRWW